MSRVTRFAARDPGPAARLAGFMAHLRTHGFRLGVGETETALRALDAAGAVQPDAVRMALKAVCTGCAEDVARFDDLFDSYWRNGGRVRQKVMPDRAAAPKHTRTSRTAEGQDSGAGGSRSC
jgi:uncharacterized protein with von Willebrand factor type A (vWA) domain